MEGPHNTKGAWGCGTVVSLASTEPLSDYWDFSKRLEAAGPPSTPHRPSGPQRAGRQGTFLALLTH